MLEKELEKKIDIILDDLEPEDLEKIIVNLCKEYYISYFSKNSVVNKSVFNNLEKLVEKYSNTYNIKSYINYSFVVAVNSFLNEYVNKDIDLKTFDVNLFENESVIVNLLEQVKEKRKELNELTVAKNGAV